MVYLVIFLAAFFEGPLATLAAGAFSAGDFALHPLQVFLAAGLGNLSADICWYLLGASGIHKRLYNWLPWLSNRKERIDEAGEMMQQHAVRLLVLSKLGLGLASIPVLVAAGVAGVRWYRMLPAVICCEVLWTGTLVVIAYTAAERLTTLTSWWPYCQVFGAVFFIGVLGLLMKRLVTAKRHEAEGVIL